MDRRDSRTRQTASVAEKDIWGSATPRSDPVLVVSRRVPGLRYVGIMNGRDFHVVFDHLAKAVHAENTQLYRNLRMRLLPGWQIWRESFVDSTGQYSLDSLTFKGARAFLDALSNSPMSRAEREHLSLVSQAFTGSMPEGILHPVPKSCPYRLASRSIPGLPLRAICVDKLLFPQLVHDGDVWLALGILTRWYNLHYASTSQSLDSDAGRRFGARAWYLPAIDRQRLLYVPMDNAPDCLLALAAHWRAMRYPCWERAVYLGNALRGHLLRQEAASPTISTASTAATAATGAMRPASPAMPGTEPETIVRVQAQDLVTGVWQLQMQEMANTMARLQSRVLELDSRLKEMEREPATEAGGSPKARERSADGGHAGQMARGMTRGMAREFQEPVPVPG